MSAEVADGGQRRALTGLRGKLMAAVRPEFRADELAFDPRDPVFGGKPCLVPACERSAVGHGLCHGHRQWWAAASRPGVGEFAESTAVRWRKDTALSRCQAPGCGYGVGYRKGLCVRHVAAWERAGMSALPTWLGMLPAAEPEVPPGGCLISSCGLWAEPGSDWCRSHGATWKRRGKPPRRAVHRPAGASRAGRGPRAGPPGRPARPAETGSPVRAAAPTRRARARRRRSSS